jgi:hypothetical protein
LLWRDIAGHWRDLTDLSCKEIDAFHAERSRSERLHQDVSNLSEVSIQRIADSMELLAKLDTALKRK